MSWFSAMRGLSAAAWRRVRESTSAQPTAPAAAPITVPSVRHAPGRQWDCVAGVVTAAARSMQLVGELQKSAQTQLEVVEFSIDSLLGELADVMRLSPELAAIRARHATPDMALRQAA